MGMGALTSGADGASHQVFNWHCTFRTPRLQQKRVGNGFVNVMGECVILASFDREGKLVISASFTLATDFHEGLAQVQVTDLLMYIDMAGNRIWEGPARRDHFAICLSS